jgi:hypothetical protein
MTALVSVETVLLILLLVLVAGLLRSHAELLRRVGPGDPAGRVPDPPARARRGEEMIAAPITGSTPHGDAISLDFTGAGAPPTLVAFLTTGCSSCAGFWSTLGEPRLPPGMRKLIVTHGSDRERPVELRRLAPESVPVVMSSRAWSDYRVPGAPYFVLVDGVVRGEGVATEWSALASMVSDAVEDQQEAEPGASGAPRARRIDETLAAAGIEPGDPSLYPGRSSAS